MIVFASNELKNSDETYDTLNKQLNIDNPIARRVEGLVNGVGKFGWGLAKGLAFTFKTAFDAGEVIGGALGNKLGIVDDDTYKSYKNNYNADVNTWKQVPGGIINGVEDVIQNTPRFFTDPNMSEKDVSNLTNDALNTAFVAKGTYDMADSLGSMVKTGLTKVSGAMDAVSKIKSFMSDLAPKSELATPDGIVINEMNDIGDSSEVYEKTDIQKNYIKAVQDAEVGGNPTHVDPNEINFSQRTVSQNVNDYISDMKSGNWDWSQSGPLRVMDRDGKLVSYDNRRLMAAQQAGLDKVPVEFVNPGDLHPDLPTTWEDAFLKRFNDWRNIKAGGPVPNTGLSSQPEIYSPRR